MRLTQVSFIDREMIEAYVVLFAKYEGDIPEREKRNFQGDSFERTINILSDLRDGGFYPISNGVGVEWYTVRKSQLHLEFEKQFGRELPIKEKPKHITDREDYISIVNLTVIQMQISGVLSEEQATGYLSRVTDCLYTANFDALEREKESLRVIYRNSAKSISDAQFSDILN